MKFNEFCKLSYSEKIQRIYDKGVYIGKRKISKSTAVIYQLHHFYFEVVYTKYRVQVSAIRQSEDINIVMPYLDQIDVKELISVS